MCANAARGGHLHILKWLRQKGYSWDASTCLHAAVSGYIEILKWAIENECPINKKCVDQIKQSISDKIIIRQREPDMPHLLDNKNNSKDDSKNDSECEEVDNSSEIDMDYDCDDDRDDKTDENIYDEILQWLSSQYCDNTLKNQ